MKGTTGSQVLLLFLSPIILCDHWDEGIEASQEGKEATDEFWLVNTKEDKAKVRSTSSEFELSYETVSNLASLPLHCYNTEYPNKLNQVLYDDDDLQSPSVLHPIFYGCFDWQRRLSCCLGGQLLPGSLSSSGLPGSLLST